jgi:hypothetical protein
MKQEMGCRNTVMVDIHLEWIALSSLLRSSNRRQTRCPYWRA